MIKVLDILKFLENYAPYNIAENWDNCGLLVGDSDTPVNKILCSLDVTLNVINEAIDTNCNLIVAHHPVIFTQVSKITSDTPTGQMLRLAIKNDISIICMHTNLDGTTDGVNDALARTLGLINLEDLGCGESGRLGRFGYLENTVTFDNFIDFVKEKINANGIKYVSGGKDVKKVALIGGSGGKLIDFAIKNNCDTFVTADCSYDVFQKAQGFGINLIDGGHFATENVVCQEIKQKITKEFGEIIEISKTHHDIINFR